MKIKYLGWAKPTDCISFSAWMDWYVDYPCERFVRTFGFEYIIKY